jgi:hypothetical protein
MARNLGCAADSRHRTKGACGYKSGRGRQDKLAKREEEIIRRYNVLVMVYMSGAHARAVQTLWREHVWEEHCSILRTLRALHLIRTHRTRSATLTDHALRGAVHRSTQSSRARSAATEPARRFDPSGPSPPPTQHGLFGCSFRRFAPLRRRIESQCTERSPFCRVPRLPPRYFQPLPGFLCSLHGSLQLRGLLLAPW